MKVCIIQPAYSVEFEKSSEYFQYELEFLEKCDNTMDIIVMPESCDVPCLAKTKAQSEASVKNLNAKLIEKASETAKRCDAMVFVNARFETENGYRNTTYAFNRNGEIAGKYFKEHLVPREVSVIELDSEYSFNFSEPTVVEIEGIKFCFLTCYDFYFYENFSNIARQNPDVIIGCSHQRSDTHEAIEIMTRFLAYNTNAYVLRSSVSMDEKSDIGGASMVVAPTGEVLLNMNSKVGMETVDIDIDKKYYKPAGFGNPMSAHYEYIERGRRPWKYRPAGSAIVKTDEIMPYPRVCAHRGFNTIAPENSMPAFGAAVAMGADEIEFDLWCTIDGELVSVHDDTLDRVSDGSGTVYKKTYEELLKYDFGIKYGEKFKDLKIVRFEDILEKFSCHVIMNIHLKMLTEKMFHEFMRLIKKYDCEKYVYIMSGDDIHLDYFRKNAPEIARCCGAGYNPWDVVERAIRCECKKVQISKRGFNQAMIDKAHKNGIRCNIFYSDDPEEAKQLLDMGIDTILTNDYNIISQVVKQYKKGL